MTGSTASGVDPDLADRLTRTLGLILTDEQRAIVFGAPAGPAAVIAGAGSGKTAVMAARMAVLAATGTVPAASILGLTFTRKAAAELAERVDGMLRTARRAGVIDPTSGEPDVATYHSFAQRFVREHGIWLGIDPDLRVEADFALLPLAYQVAARSSILGDLEHSFTLPTAVAAMRRLDAALAEHVVDTEQVRRQEAQRQELLAATAGRSEPTRRLLAASQSRVAASWLVDAFRTAKADAGVMDYADMMRLAYVIAAGSDEAVRRTREAHGGVLLDEYQDTSVVQRRLLQRLFGDGHRVLAVGDPKQSIYAFRGAAAASMEAFVDHFPAADGSPAVAFALTTNFRSGATIVDVANAAAASRRAVRAGSPGGRLQAGRTDIEDAVEVHTFRAAADESHFVVERVREELTHGRAPDEVLVLARSNADVAYHAAALAAVGIPVTSSDQAGLFEVPVVSDLLAVLAVVVDPGANAELMRLLTGPRWAIGLRDLALLGARARQLAGGSWRPDADAAIADQFRASTAGSDPVELPSLADALADPGDGPFSADARHRFSALHAELDDLARHAGEPVPDLLARILRVTGMDTEVLLGDDAAARLAAVDSLLAVAAQFQAAEVGSGAAGFLRAVRLAEQGGADPGFDPPPPQGCVRVMTVHKAKGLEAAVVLLPGLSEPAYDTVTLKDHWTTTPGSLPDDLRGDVEASGDAVLAPGSAAEVAQLRELASREAAAEAERLVYVALTRARSRLIVSSHWWTPGRVRPRRPSRHLLDLAEMPEVTVGQWYEPSDGACNPLVAQEADEQPFPRWNPAAVARRRAAAASVLQARELPASDLPPATNEGDAALIARWDADIEALRRERLAEAQRDEVITLPEGLTVTALQHLLQDPAAYASAVRRPMPPRPSVQARRGTRFHEWVASRWDQRPLIDETDVAADRALDQFDDAGLRPLVAAFEASSYANRAPSFIEHPFTVTIAGVPVTGRIDAIYADGDDWEVVDWKTSGRPEADPVQLAVYRLAWAKLAGVEVDRVSAAFFYVPTGLRVAPSDLPDEATLGRWLTSGKGATD